MRVHEYAGKAGVGSDTVLQAIQDSNADLPEGEENIAATTAMSSLDEREQGLLDRYLKPSKESEEISIDEIFGMGEEFGGTGPLAEADAVDEAFSHLPGHSLTKEIPMRQFACHGRDLRGKSDDVKRIIVANDESEAINIACAEGEIDPSDYKFQVRKVKDLPHRVANGSPLKNVGAA
jgi:hypothetical protein